jgi:hypothetical protein
VEAADLGHDSGVRICLAALLAALLVPAALAASRPSIHAVSLTPTRIAGTGFHPAERVMVTVRSDTAVAHVAVRSTARGSFVARLAKPLAKTPCGQIAVMATGAHGDHATWKSPPRVCGTQLAP